MAGHVLKAANAEKAELVVVEMYGVACVAYVACLCVVKGGWSQYIGKHVLSSRKSCRRPQMRGNLFQKSVPTYKRYTSVFRSIMAVKLPRTYSFKYLHP